MAAVAIGVGAERAYTHPLHTTLTELSSTADGGVQIVIRAFVDDFSAAIAGGKHGRPSSIGAPSDSAAARYLAATLALTDGEGRQVQFAVARIRRTGDLVWVTLRAPAVRPLAGARLTNRVLFERYDDQVNIVQTNVAGRRQTLLFTTRDRGAAKPIA